MPTSFVPTAADLLRLSPDILLTVGGALMMVIEPLTSPSKKGRMGAIAAFLIACAIALSAIAYSNPGTSFSGMLVVDGFSTFFRMIVYGCGLLAVLMSIDYFNRERGDESGEYYTLIVFSLVGQSLMASANELVLIFIGLEISSISGYIMAGYIRDDKRNNESALKYFLLGSFATAFMLYGVAWIYGLTGSTNLDAVRRAILGGAQDQSGSMLIIATILIFVGFAFKISAAPFHIWAPDVYQGAPAPVAGFLSAGPKAAAFAMLIRVACSAFYPLSDQWEPLFWATALATMIIGNFAAIRQSNIKRMLAYSSIAHAGYILVAVTAQSEIGIAAVMFYLAAYTLMTMGVFAAVTLVASKGERYVEIEDFAGLMQRQPLVAGALTIFLFSLIGIPLTGGFFAKFYVFKAALDSNLTWLTVLGLLNSAVAAFYYLRVLVVMFMKPAPAGAETMAAPGIAIRVTLLVSAIGTVYLGVYPSAVLDFAGKAAQMVR